MAGQRSRFNIDVTADDIEKAHVGDSYKCVIAQAIARQVTGSRRIEVDIQTIRWSDENGRHVFLTPFSAASYIVAFDAGDEIEPFRFQLRDPVQAAQKQARSEAAKAAKASRDKIYNERQRQQTAQAVLDDPNSSPDKVAAAEKRLEDAPERIAAATTAHEELKDTYEAAGVSISEERVTETPRRATPMTKTKKREYGHRIFRVNQAEGRKHYA